MKFVIEIVVHSKIFLFRKKSHYIYNSMLTFYCGLTVHITDTRAQKVAGCTSAQITETVLAHDRPTVGGAKQFILSTAVSSFAKAQKMDNHTVGYYTTGVSTCPTFRGARHFPSTSYFCIAWCVHSVHIFLLHKSNTDETQTPKQFTNNYCILVSIQEC